jgi:hypothetical protein
MPVTVRNTDILFNDGTTQTTAAGAIPTDFGAVGTYAVLMMAANNNLATNGTIAGSSLRFNYSANSSSLSSGGNHSPFQGSVFHTVNSYNGGGTSVSGTWRKMSTGQTYRQNSDAYGNLSWNWQLALYVRIS